MPEERVVVTSLYSNEEQIEAVTALYLQHFLIDANPRNRDQFLKDMLTSKYKEWPRATNFASARTIILLRKDVVVSAATIRLHKMSHSKFLEVILFATHKNHVKKGYGGLLSSVLLWKAHAAGCRHILLRSSNSSTFFWCSQGYQAYPYSKTTKTDAIMCYYDNYCLAFPETVLMYREVENQYPWVEISLKRCQEKLVLDDMDVSVTPLGSRSRLGPAPTQVACTVHPMTGTLDPETRKGCGLFDNEKLTAEQLQPPKQQPAKKRRGWQATPAVSPEPPAKRRQLLPGGTERHPQIFANEAQAVQYELLQTKEQLRLLRERKAYVAQYVTAAQSLVEQVNPNADANLYLQAEAINLDALSQAMEKQDMFRKRLEARKEKRGQQQRAREERFQEETNRLQAGQWPQMVGCPDLSAVPRCMMVNSNLMFPSMLGNMTTSSAPSMAEWTAMQAGEVQSAGPPAAMSSSCAAPAPKPLLSPLGPVSSTPQTTSPNVLPMWQQRADTPFEVLAAQQAQYMQSMDLQRQALCQLLSNALNSVQPAMPSPYQLSPGTPFMPMTSPNIAGSVPESPALTQPLTVTPL